MKTLHIVYSFPPDPPGGTELYVASLCRELGRLGQEAIVAAPAPEDRAYEIGDVRVKRFRHLPDPPLEALYVGDAVAAEHFGHLLDEEHPDVVHQHAVSPACSTLLAHEARRRRMPVVFTYHSPTATCQRGTLLEHGQSVCDGRLDVRRCTSCALDGLGVGPVAAWFASHVPASAGEAVAAAGGRGGVWTALRFSSLIGRRHHGWRRFTEDVDRFVALTGWVEGVLTATGVPVAKIVRSPHGIDAPPALSRPRVARDGVSLRLAHLGRADPVKGTALLLRALGALPGASIELDIFGVAQDGGGTALLQTLREVAASDARVRFLDPLPNEEVVARLRDYDMVVVPSQWMETGPLVVLEAFAAGTPVLGSALGGIADKVRHDIDGILVEPHASDQAWTAALDRCVRDLESVRGRMARAVRAPRTASAVARDMTALYESLAPGAPVSEWATASPVSAVQ